MFEHRPDQPSGPASTALRKMRRGAGASFLAPHSGHYEGLFIRPPQRFHQTTNPCAIAYNYARIRPLVRLVHGFYRFPATAHQWSGLAARYTKGATAPRYDCHALWHWHPHVMAGCARIPSGMPGSFRSGPPILRNPSPHLLGGRR